MNSQKKEVRDVQPIDTSHPVNLGWANELCKKFRDELGAVHLGTLAAHASIGHVVLAREDGQNLGCLVSKPKSTVDSRIFPIIAAAVPDDLQRLHVGLSMLHALGDVHKLERTRIFQAICREDLPSNRFWAAAGFHPIAVRHSSSVRAVPCIIWRKRLDGSDFQIDRWHADPRERVGGGRFAPANRPDLANIYDFTPEGIEEACRRSGARPRVGGWESVEWDRPQVNLPARIERPPRPGEPQMKLFVDDASQNNYDAIRR